MVIVGIEYYYVDWLGLNSNNYSIGVGSTGEGAVTPRFLVYVEVLKAGLK